MINKTVMKLYMWCLINSVKESGLKGGALEIRSEMVYFGDGGIHGGMRTSTSNVDSLEKGSLWEMECCLSCPFHLGSHPEIWQE